MKVVHVCSNIASGGAAQATLNLHRGLLKSGIHSSVLSNAPAENVEFFYEYEDHIGVRRAIENASWHLVWNNRSSVSNSHFSLDLLGREIASHPALRAADLIHLHWTAEFLSSASISRLADLGKPIVWTLHDMRPLTGGCHFSAGCQKFQVGCGNCPQLVLDKWSVVPGSFRAQQEAVRRAAPVFVAPSKWMKQIAASSGISADQQTFLIPYGVDTDVFTAGDKRKARSALCLAPEVTYILFASHSLKESRKGGEEAVILLERLASAPGSSAQVKNGKLRLLCCGHETDAFAPAGWTIDRLGYLKEDRMALLYQSADILLFTSREDNLPNVILEAMACGLAVAAHGIGGVVDLIGAETKSGILLDPSDREASVRAIERLCSHPIEREKIGKEARNVILTSHTLMQQSQAYLSLYQSIGKERAQSRSSMGSLQEGAVSGATVELSHSADHFHLESEKNLEECQQRLETLLRIEGDLKRSLLEAHTLREDLKRIRAELAVEKSTSVITRVKRLLAFHGGRIRYEVIGRVRHYARLGQYHLGRVRFIIHRGIQEKIDFLLSYEMKHWMQLGIYHHYSPKPLEVEMFPKVRLPKEKWPSLAIVTPSFRQGHFIEKTIRSVVESGYPSLSYAVVDGGSLDDTVSVVKRYEDKIAYAVSEKDEGQADAIVKGFRHVGGEIMAYLNADDVFMPGALLFVGEYFAANPEVDVIYGYRVIIDERGQEVGRWVLPPHCNDSTKRFDYIPQETMFWRRDLYERVGGVDPQMRFAMDWDLILRFISAGAKFRRVPYFLGCFRAHESQKSQTILESVGAEESRRLMIRELGEDEARWNVSKYHRRYRRRAMVTMLLHERGVRW